MRAHRYWSSCESLPMENGREARAVIPMTEPPTILAPEIPAIRARRRLSRTGGGFGRRLRARRNATIRAPRIRKAGSQSGMERKDQSVPLRQEKQRRDWL